MLRNAPVILRLLLLLENSQSNIHAQMIHTEDGEQVAYLRRLMVGDGYPVAMYPIYSPMRLWRQWQSSRRKLFTNLFGMLQFPKHVA